MRLSHFASIISIALAACGGSSGSSDGVDGTPGADGATPDGRVDVATRFLPWQVGSVWSYKLTDPKGQLADALDRKTTILAEMDVGGVHAGKTAFKVHHEQLTGSKTVFEGFDGDKDVRYETIHYADLAGTQMTSTDVDMPYRLKLDESPAHLATGATFTESFTETTTGQGAGTVTKSENWQVIDGAEQVTVIAGTYTCVHIRRTGSSPQDYWYARGVGKVKETGSGAQNEELMSYTP